MVGCFERCSRRKAFDSSVLIGVRLDRGIHLAKTVARFVGRFEKDYFLR